MRLAGEGRSARGQSVRALGLTLTIEQEQCRMSTRQNQKLSGVNPRQCTEFLVLACRHATLFLLRCELELSARSGVRGSVSHNVHTNIARRPNEGFFEHYLGFRLTLEG